jgi:hypothetical protein
VEALALARAIGDRHDVAWLLEDLAMIGATQGPPELAARLFGAAAALRKAFGMPSGQYATADYRQRTGSVRTALGEARFAAAWAEGQAMTLEQAVDAALAGPTEAANSAVADRPGPDDG